MFAKRFWGNRMFAPRYWPKVGSTAITPTPPFDGRAYVEHVYSGLITITHPDSGRRDIEHVGSGDIQAP